MLCIGLFGTCGNSAWRKEFMEKYNEKNIQYFNPQVENWTPELAEVEAQHLVDDDIVLFPVTNETSGLGSLAETGYSIMQAINTNVNRSVVIMIDKDVSEELCQSDPTVAKESMRSRALVKAHLSKIKRGNVYIVESLQDMLEVSLHLYEAYSTLQKINKYSSLK